MRDALPAEIDIRPTAYQRKLIGGELKSWHRLLASLVLRPDDAQLFNLGRRLADCCRNPVACVTPCGHLKAIEYRCKSRHCPICRKRRCASVTAKVTKAIKYMNAPRFVTLTLAASNDPLRDQLQRLTKAFKELRRSNLWQKHVTGGIYTVEVTFNAAGQKVRSRRRDARGQAIIHEVAEAAWHPHIHVICDGTYMPQAALSDAWFKATGDSRIVDIRKVNDANGAAREMAAYIAKTSDPARLPDERWPEWIISTRGLRFVQTFGRLHAVKLDRAEKGEKLPKDLVELGSLAKLARAAEAADPEARELFAFILAIRGRRIPVPDEGQTAGPPAREQAIVERLRAWFSAREDQDDEQTSRNHDPPGRHCPDDRPERLWQDELDPEPRQRH